MTGRYRAYSDYKDAGLKFLEKIPSNWQTSKLRFLAQFGRGLNITKENLQDTGIPCISYGEVHSKYGFEVDPQIHNLMCVSDEYIQTAPYALLSKGDIVFADTSEDVDGSGNFSQLISDSLLMAGYHTVVVRPVSNVHFRYLAYVLDSSTFRNQIRDAVKGVKVFSITQAILKDANVWLPSFVEQQKIADFLDHETAKIDTLIAKQEKLIELLKEKRKAVISHAVTKGLNPNAPMKDSGVEWLGEVPEHWSVTQFKFNVFQIQTGPFGSQLHADDYVTDGIPLINPAHMIGGNIIPDVTVTVDLDTQKRLGRHKLKKDDIIFARRGELGRCAVVQEEQAGWLCGTGSLKATLNNRLVPDYAYLLVTSKGVISELSLESKGSTMENLNTETLGRIRIPLPPIQEQESILTYVDKIAGKYDELINKAERAITLIKERKLALISAAVTGKIDVSSCDGHH